MKKIFTLLVAACTVLAASAQAQLMRMNTMQPKVATMTAAQKLNFAPMGQARKAAGAINDTTQTDTLFYGRPDYAYHVGYTPSGNMYYPMIIASNKDSLVFIKDNTCMHTTAQFDWTQNGSQLSHPYDTLVFATPGAMTDGGAYYMPGLIDENNNSYLYGESESAQYLVAGCSDYMPLTKCAMYTSTVVDPASGSSDGGWDMYYMNWDESGNMFMGTGMAPRFSFGNYAIDTLYTYMGTPNTYSEIDTVTLYVWSTQADPLPASGSGLKLIVSDGTHGVTYTAHTSDIKYWSKSSTGSNYFGLLNFPVKGRMAGEYMCALMGFQQSGNKIACMTDYYIWNYFDGDIYPTYMLAKGYGYSYGNNIALFVNSKYIDDFTALDDVEAAAPKTSKVIEDGKLYILKNGVKYNANGMIVK